MSEFPPDNNGVPGPGLDSPPATAGDQLVGRVIVCIAVIALIALLGVIGLAVYGSTAPDVLENVLVGSVTGLLALLAGRTRG